MECCAARSLRHHLDPGFRKLRLHYPEQQCELWAKDDWKVTKKLTLNLGLRYDNDLGILIRIRT